MSSKNNDEMAGIVMVFALIGGMVYAAVLVVGFVIILGIAVLTVGLTILSLIAWNRPVRAFGQVVMPEEARRFIKRGLHGFWMFPYALLLLGYFSGLRINWDYLWVYLFIGYAMGSLGMECIPTHDENGQPLIEILPPDYQPPRQEVLLPPAREHRPAPEPEPEPFRFASWDDEERAS
ncbi:hypothetical protein [Nitrobacter sp.]|uniref:hypothetical protein n=1 Tax=unclassified Nitrobacter TaxID=2620411 RepID=UPI00321FD187